MKYKKKNIAILGSTGSVGVQSLKIISKFPHIFNVNLLICNKNYKEIISQINKFLPKHVFINDLKAYYLVKKKIFKKNINLYNKFSDLVKILKTEKKYDQVIAGIPSFEGLKYCFLFVNFTKNLLVANKESVICGGGIFLKKAKAANCKILSIDSEHYCLSQILKNYKLEYVESVYLTASGGPFLNKKNKLQKKFTIKDVINHPTWNMGKKISVDSATMVNKIFELIEAHVLFSIPINKIKIKIHKESLVHSGVVLKNGIVHLIMHDTSMEIPIRNTLFENNYFKQKDNYFKKTKNFILSFDEHKLKEFDILNIGYNVLKLGHAAWIVFNVINDLLVSSFLRKEIFFYEITLNLIKIFKKRSVILYCKKPIKKFSDIEKTIIYSRQLFEKI